MKWFQTLLAVFRFFLDWSVGESFFLLLMFSGGIVETEILAGGAVLVWEPEIAVISTSSSLLIISRSPASVLSLLEGWREGERAVRCLFNCLMIGYNGYMGVCMGYGHDNHTITFSVGGPVGRPTKASNCPDPPRLFCGPGWVGCLLNQKLSKPAP